MNIVAILIPLLVGQNCQKIVKKEMERKQKLESDEIVLANKKN